MQKCISVLQITKSDTFYGLKISHNSRLSFLLMREIADWAIWKWNFYSFFWWQSIRIRYGSNYDAYDAYDANEGYIWRMDRWPNTCFANEKFSLQEKYYVLQRYGFYLKDKRNGLFIYLRIAHLCFWNTYSKNRCWADNPFLDERTIVNQ